MLPAVTSLAITFATTHAFALVSVVAPDTARDQVLKGVVLAIAIEMIDVKVDPPLDLATAVVASVRPGPIASKRTSRCSRTHPLTASG